MVEVKKSDYKKDEQANSTHDGNNNSNNTSDQAKSAPAANDGPGTYGNWGPPPPNWAAPTNWGPPGGWYPPGPWGYPAGKLYLKIMYN